MTPDPAALPGKRTLSGRLTRSISLLTLVLFLLFSGALFFVVYALEDAVYREQLKEVGSERRDGDRPAGTFSVVQDLSAFQLTESLPNPAVELEPDEIFGEFSAGGRHYHYMVQDDGYLLHDVTDISFVRRALDDILLVLLFLLIPALLLSLWVARATARHALMPFQQLGNMFAESQSAPAVNHALLETIGEEDVKQIARQLVLALEAKARALDQQATFSQGMAHELRTPLQVMTHSLELLALKSPELVESGAFSRLEKSLNRMQRTSTGLLWLTSDQRFTDTIDARETIVSALDGLRDVLEAHCVEVAIDSRRACRMPMPREVMVLIVANLLSNLVHHGQATGGHLSWRIVIDSDSVRFSNPSGDSRERQCPEKGFGIGLLLVEKLARRFALTFKCTDEQGVFTIVLGREQVE